MSIGFKHCPKCLSKCVMPSGSSKDMLIIGEFPGEEELRQGVPFAFSRNFMTAGQILRQELKRVDLHLQEFKVSNLWVHTPNKDEDCFKIGYNLALEEAKGKKAILLVGSDVVEAFTEYKVSDVSGLRVDSSILSAPLIMAMVNPAIALHRGVGEVRFAIERWKEMLEKENLI